MTLQIALVFVAILAAGCFTTWLAVVVFQAAEYCEEERGARLRSAVATRYGITVVLLIVGLLLIRSAVNFGLQEYSQESRSKDRNAVIVDKTVHDELERLLEHRFVDADSQQVLRAAGARHCYDARRAGANPGAEPRSGEDRRRREIDRSGARSIADLASL
jgi:hypothetical protein